MTTVGHGGHGRGGHDAGVSTGVAGRGSTVTRFATKGRPTVVATGVGPSPTRAWSGRGWELWPLAVLTDAGLPPAWASTGHVEVAR